MAKLAYGQLDLTKITAAFKAGAPGFTKVQFKDGEHILCKIDVVQSVNPRNPEMEDHFIAIRAKKEESEAAKQNGINLIIGGAKKVTEQQAPAKPVEKPVDPKTDGDDLPF